jgi:hypothetical protein
MSNSIKPTSKLTIRPTIRATNKPTTAFGGHVEGRVGLSDIIEILDDRHFLLHGRHADLVNIAGKRTSLAYLNHQIAAIPGVVDAAFFLPDDETPDGITRLAAFVVAPGLSNRQLMAALRLRVDPIFLPRPLVLLEKLPRNSTGKLPRVPSCRCSTPRRSNMPAAEYRWPVPADHPGLCRPFPRPSDCPRRRAARSRHSVCRATARSPGARLASRQRQVFQPGRAGRNARFRAANQSQRGNCLHRQNRRAGYRFRQPDAARPMSGRQTGRRRLAAAAGKKQSRHPQTDGLDFADFRPRDRSRRALRHRRLLRAVRAESPPFQPGLPERALGRWAEWSDGFRHVLAFASTIHDRIYLLNDRFDLFDIEIIGAEALDASLAKQPGALLIGAHLGSFEVLRAVGRGRAGLKVAMLMYEENARKINAALEAINPAATADIIALGRMDSMIEARDKLDQGYLVGMLADRGLGDDATVDCEFLGEIGPLPGRPFPHGRPVAPAGVFHGRAVSRRQPLPDSLRAAGRFLGNATRRTRCRDARRPAALR